MEDLQVSHPEDLQVSRLGGRPVVSLCIKILCYEIICVNFFVKLHYQTNLRKSCLLYFPKGSTGHCKIGYKIGRLLIVKSSNILDDLNRLQNRDQVQIHTSA